MSIYNDYSKKNFFIKKRGDEKEYFIRVGEKYVKVSSDVFKVCKNEYFTLMTTVC